MWFGVYAMAYSLLAESICAQIVNAWPNKKLLDYGYIDQIKDIMPAILLAVFMGFCVYPIVVLRLPAAITLLIQIAVGGVIYVTGSKVFHLEAFGYLWTAVKPLVMKVIRRK